MTGFRFANVSHDYGDFAAVADLTLEVKTGETVCLLGASGCGKTTTLRLLAGAQTPACGEIYIGDKLVSDKTFAVPPEKRGIGFLFQEYALFPHLSVMDNVLFGLANRKTPKARTDAHDLLSKAGVAHLAQQYPAQLSGGEQQRVALARALAPAPGLILMDEPFSSLDSQLRDTIRKLTLDLLHDAGATSLIVTHDADDALRLADKVAVMRGGKIVQYDSPETVYNAPCDAHVASLFGRINSIKLRFEAGGENKTPFGDLAAHATGARDVTLAVRPHDILLGVGAGGDDIQFKAIIKHIRPLGADMVLDICLQDGSLWEAQTRHADLHALLPKTLPKRGAEAAFHIAANKLKIFDA